MIYYQATHILKLPTYQKQYCAATKMIPRGHYSLLLKIKQQTRYHYTHSEYPIPIKQHGIQAITSLPGKNTAPDVISYLYKNQTLFTTGCTVLPKSSPKFIFSKFRNIGYKKTAGIDSRQLSSSYIIIKGALLFSRRHRHQRQDLPSNLGHQVLSSMPYSLHCHSRRYPSHRNRRNYSLFSPCKILAFVQGSP